MTTAEMIVIVWCLSVMVHDLHTRRIPNLLTLGGMLLAIVWLALTGLSVLGASWQSALLAAVISLVLTIPAYVTGKLGAADVKLLLAIALLAGSTVMLVSFVIAALLGLLFVLGRLVLVKTHAATQKRWIPVGAAFAGGLLCVLGAS